MGRDYRATEYPSDTIEVAQDNVDMFFKFMWERHNIWINRFKKKLPKDQWTNDEILKHTKYTNIYICFHIWCWISLNSNIVRFHVIKT